VVHTLLHHFQTKNGQVQGTVEHVRRHDPAKITSRQAARSQRSNSKDCRPILTGGKHPSNSIRGQGALGTHSEVGRTALGAHVHNHNRSARATDVVVPSIEPCPARSHESSARRDHPKVELADWRAKRVRGSQRDEMR
jgi:hypothetical protein